MLLELKNLSLNEPHSFQSSFLPQADLQVREDLVFLDEVQVDGFATLLEDNTVNICGQVVYTLSGQCDRCLSDAKHTITARFSEDYDQQNEIDLSPLFRDLVLNSLPSSFICNKGCKGICQYCGANQNTSPCKCNHQDLEKTNPFEILKSGGTKNGSSKKKNVQAED